MKKLTALLLCLLLTLGCLSLSALAEDAPAPEGTPITDVYGLMEIEEDGTYYLANDILISGDYESPVDFAGTLDGQGHTIVLSNAEISGGLFNHLKGATIKNLNIVEGEEPNSLMMKPASNGTDYLAGALADCGYGTIGNVTVDVNIDVSVLGMATAGGVIGAMQDGALTLVNCVNAGNVSAGRYGGGLVGLALNAVTFNLTVEQCVNYGTITGKYSAGGIVGQNNGNSLGVAIRRCVNYGDVSNSSGNQAGGILAFGKPASSGGIIELSNNINYGYIHNTNIEADNCQIAGIFTRMNCGGGTLILKGNVNYNALELQDGYTAQVVFGILSVATGGLQKGNCEIENNYSVPVKPIDGTTAPEAVGDAALLDDTTFASLNEKYAEVYVEQEGQIALSWMQKAGLGKEAPVIEYDVEGQEEIKEPEVTTDPPSTTEEPEPSDEESQEESSEPEQTTAPAGGEDGGCASSIGAVSAIAMVGLVSIIGVALKKRKNNIDKLI